jgi:phosphoribosylformylglycinamidine synthase
MVRADALLFSESQSRIVVSLQEKDLSQLQELAAQHNTPLLVIGTVGGTRLVIQPLVQLPVEELKSIWVNGLEKRLK